MSNKEITEQILNKKFKKSVFSGYDAADVDMYFDYVIEYLKKNDETLQTCQKDIVNLKTKVLQLENEKSNLIKENNKLALKVKEFEEEGYGNITLKKQRNI